MNDTYDDKDDTAYTETMNHGKSSQKKGESSRDKKRSGSDAQRKSGGRDRGGSKSGKNSTQKRFWSDSEPNLEQSHFDLVSAKGDLGQVVDPT